MLISILTTFYKKVTLLENYLNELDPRLNNLIQPGDDFRYVELLQKSIVAFNTIKTIDKKICLEQNFNQAEIVLHILERLCAQHPDENNVLSMGYRLLSGTSSKYIPVSIVLESCHQNSNTTFVQSTPWQILHSRIGDEVMLHLLEYITLFIFVPPSCYIQIMGKPIWDLSPIQSNVRCLTCKAKNITTLPTLSSSEKIDEEKHKSLPRFGPSKIFKKEKSFHRKKNEGSGKLKNSDFTVTNKDKKRLDTKITEIEIQPLKTRKKTKRGKRRKMVVHQPIIKQSFDFHQVIPFITVLYSKNLAEYFPCKHILCVVKPNETGIKKLLESIFSEKIVRICDMAASEKAVGDRNSWQLLKSSLMKLIKRHRKLIFTLHLVLNHCCPYEIEDSLDSNVLVAADIVQDGDAKPSTSKFNLKHKQKLVQSIDATNKSQGKTDISSLLKKFSKTSEVFKFLRKVCFVLPKEFLGSQHNWNIFQKQLKRLILLNKFDKVTIGSLMKNIKLHHIKWINFSHDQLDLQLIVSKFIYWFTVDYILVVLRASFYITETSLYRNKLFFYRKPVWSLIHQHGFSDYIDKKIFSPINQGLAEKLIESSESLGASPIRFLPKQSSLRPIINLGKKLPNSRFSINIQLANVQRILTLLKEQSPEIIGCSKFGIDNVYTTWKQYLTNRILKNDNRPLYFVKLDIKKCYDTILHQKLYDILKNMSMEEKYVIRTYFQIIKTVHDIKRHFQKNTASLKDFEQPFGTFVGKLQEKYKLKNAILVEKVVHQYLSYEEIIKLLRVHIFQNLIKDSNQFYQQIQGISQGSCLSVILCDFYYSSMEKDYLFIQPYELLMRQVDDFLFVTPHANSAKQFLQLLLNGIPEYNCYVNADKTVVNFPYTDERYPEIQCLDTKDAFSWCGILINTETMDVVVDYIKYTGISISTTISIEFSSHPVICMKNRIIKWFLPKCHAMFLDLQINSIKCVLINIFQSFLMSAFKFHSWMKCLSFKRINVVYFKDMILEFATCYYYFAHNCVCVKTGIVFPFTIEEITWLCVLAFDIKLQKKKAIYSRLLHQLSIQRQQCENKMDPEKIHNWTEFIPKDIPEEFSNILA